MTALSVIVPVYGSVHLLMNLLASLGRTMTPEEQKDTDVVLVDDCFPGLDLRQLLVLQGSKILRSGCNRGFSGACNLGATAAAGDVLLFLNSDTLAHPGWRQPLLDAFAQANVGIAGPKLVFPPVRWCPQCRAYQGDWTMNPDGSIPPCPAHGCPVEMVEQIQNAGGWYDAGKGPFHRYLGWRSDAREANVPEAVSWTTGAAFAVRKTIFEQMKGFDPGYVRGYFEDVDACERAKKAGWMVWYEPRSVFTHLVGQSMQHVMPAGVLGDYFMQNSRRFHRLWNDRIKADTPGAVYVNY